MFSLSISIERPHICQLAASGPTFSIFLIAILLYNGVSLNPNQSIAQFISAGCGVRRKGNNTKTNDYNGAD